MLRNLGIPNKCFSVLALALALAASAAPGMAYTKGFSVVYAFEGQRAGEAPKSDVIEGVKGRLYGTTEYGGNNRSCNCGTVFKLDPNGITTKRKILHRFRGTADGEYPTAGLVADGTGNFYGTTSGLFPRSCGTAFKIALDGTETVLHVFTGGSDGCQPMSALAEDSNGNFYGTTYNGGGGAGCGNQGCGTVFEIAPDGTETLLHAFTGNNDGAFPAASLLPDKTGNLYGTTQGGGSSGLGTVFRIAADRSESVLYEFKGGTDGAEPQTRLLADGSGNLYGTTLLGGSLTCGAIGCGTVYRLAPDGTETVMLVFSGANGALPEGDLVADDAGNLYGTTTYGGERCGRTGCGTVFQLAPDGTQTLLHSFGGKDGRYPGAGLTRIKSGNLVFAGTTVQGGRTDTGCTRGCGTVFEITK